MFWFRIRQWVGSRKRELAVLITAIAIVGVAAVAADTPQLADMVTVPRADVEAVIAELQSWLDDITTTTGPTTTQSPTTTQPETTTTGTPTTTTEAPTTTEVPTTTSASTTTTSPPSAACSAVVSMSQGRQLYAGAPGLEALLDGEWMVAFSPGRGLVRWTDPALWGTLNVQNRCGADNEIGRVVFIYDGTDSPGAAMAANLDTVAGIVANRYPNATFIPTLFVGADNHVVCPFGNGVVYASEGHAARIGEALAYPGSGPDLDIPCSGYSDGTGHLTATGATDAQQDLANFFSNPPSTTTTTTEAPTTTVSPTTTLPPLFIPETIPHPVINSVDGYRIDLVDLRTSTGLWAAPYLHRTPYLPGSGWRNGDRVAYHCVYGFLEHDGQLVGRFTFRAVPTADNSPDEAYVLVGDKFMEEPGADQNTAGGPNRFYNGDLNTTNRQAPFSECPQDTGVVYEPGAFPDERPIIVFVDGGEAVELRDYATINPAGGVTFQIVDIVEEPFAVITGRGSHTVTSRVSVLARFNDDPAVVVYYDGLGSGSVIVAP